MNNKNKGTITDDYHQRIVIYPQVEQVVNTVREGLTKEKQHQNLKPVTVCVLVHWRLFF